MTALFPKLGFANTDLALVAGGRSLGYKELAAEVAGYQAWLASEGIVAGDRIAVWADPDVEPMVAFLGNALAGVVSVPLNPKLGQRELRHIVGDAQPRLVLANHAEVAADIEGVPTRVFGRLSNMGVGGLQQDFSPDAIAFVLYTSGTTGAPKGAMITLGNVVTNLDALAEAWRWTSDDTVVHALPMFHVHGLILGLFGSLRVGGTLHHVGRFDANAIGKALLDAEKNAVLFAVPTMIRRLADGAESEGVVREGLKQARLLISGSAGLPVSEHRRIEQLVGRGVHERYGLTESLINCAIQACDPPMPGYVGPALRDVELRLVDDNRCTIDATDHATIGEIAVRGKAVFAGYLNNEEATRRAMDDEGWFYTGDLARRTSTGAVALLGRRQTDLIKTGGYRVGADEIESCLLAHPTVQEVAVVGVLDTDLGQRIEAHVVPADKANAPAEKDLIDWVAEQLTPHKRPRKVHFIEALPTNAMGKVQKKLLMERT